MMILLRTFLLGVVLWSLSFVAIAQEQEFSSALDSARAAEDNKQDSVVFSARYVRYTTLAALKQRTQTFQIDTTHHNFQYYNKQQLPWNPSIHLGSYGLATRDLLFNPNKSIGFQPGYYGLDRYLIKADSVQYYRARARYSELYAVGFFFDDQIFRAKLAQNLHSRLNIGAEYNAANTDGFYQNQQYSDRKGSVFSWYESPSLRYNLLTNFTFNTLDASENGSIVNDQVFSDNTESRGSMSELPNLSGTNANRPRTKWKDIGFFLRQSLYVGRIDTINKNLPEMEIRPTNVMAHNTYLRNRRYMFFKNEADANGVFPVNNMSLVGDTTSVTTLTNEFTYSFFLRSPSLANEIKLDLGFQNDLIWYGENIQGGPNDLVPQRDTAYRTFFQNSMIKGKLGYQFSDRLDVSLGVNQIVLGENFGDFLYEAQANISGGDNLGHIQLGAYTQNKSPEMIFQRANLSYHQWRPENTNFNNTTTQNLSFAYVNPKLRFSGKAEYFLMNGFMYFREIPNPENLPSLMRQIEPAQYGALNLLKLTLSQNFSFRKFHLDNMAVYQKSDAMAVLAIPELYTWHSFYYADVLSQVLDFRLGLDARINTPFRNPSYALNAGQFYNDNAGIEFSTYPIFDIWATANIKRVNLFLSYNFVNQHIYPAGYYTVRRYPMQNANLRFGVSWKFYD
ncbi:putative porin [Sphingobacterium sp. lm-10]|uniref:putative porin n=1 Tax=Sphingobacterium sp. lm-10 TaxID=2944904 RepID=UPI0020219876|nr:putative porin [Sphingobacterium sp. lm-10]MCL7988518.1 putative porin [Sphingobacterium sp. lm-10]